MFSILHAYAWLGELPSVPAVAILASFTMSALSATLTTVIRVGHDINASSPATFVAELALVATLAAVILIPEHVPAMLLAAVKKGCSFIRWYSITHIFLPGLTMLAFLDAGQEPAPQMSAGKWRIKNILFLILLLLFKR